MMMVTKREKEKKIDKTDRGTPRAIRGPSERYNKYMASVEKKLKITTPVDFAQKY